MVQSNRKRPQRAFVPIVLIKFVQGNVRPVLIFFSGQVHVLMNKMNIPTVLR